MFINSRKKRDYHQSLDDNQEEYRKFFGIKDKYLIQRESVETEGKKTGYIVYIDLEDDIDWIDLRDDFWNAEDKKQRDAFIAQLNVLQFHPCQNISDEDKFTFKKMLGSIYVLALQKQFDAIPTIMKETENFIIQRNKEAARTMYLELSGVIAFIVLVFWIFDAHYLMWCKEWVAGIAMGILGSYVSVWIRYGKVTMKGLSSRWLHYLESISRLFIGGVFAIVSMTAVKCGVILSNSDPTLLRFTFALVGFASGFSERFVPSMIERFIDSKTNE